MFCGRKPENTEETQGGEHAQKRYTDGNLSCEMAVLSAVPPCCPLADICHSINQISSLFETYLFKSEGYKWQINAHSGTI